MTIGVRRWTRRSKSNDISNWLAAIWRNGPKNAGSIKVNLLGKGRIREMVAVALLLTTSNIVRVEELMEKGAMDIDVAPVDRTKG